MFLSKSIAAGALALTLACAAGPASAGPVPAGNVQVGVTIEVVHAKQWRYLSPREIRRVLRWHGFVEIRFLDRHGAVYVARAEDHRGRDVIIRVSARTGHILSVKRIRDRGRDHEHEYRDDRPRCWLPEGCR